MAPTWLDKNVHPNTLEETEKILNKLRTRKINCRTGDELTKFFAKLNAENGHKTLENGGMSPGIRGEHQVTYGPISSIPPGAWWGNRMDLSRALVHTPLENPLSPTPLGAISLCTPHSNPHEDLDLGDYLTFTTPSPTPPSTHPLILSSQNNLPIRLIRGHNLRNKYSPKTGYRYDGLYLVIAFWLTESPTASTNLRFALARVDQEAPPWDSAAPELHSPFKNTRNASKINQKHQLNPQKPEKPLKSSPSDHLNSPATPQHQQIPKTQESSIVMRRVSKKCNSMKFGESPKLNNSQKSIIKLQNSIERDSPGPQDVKRTPMTFCRVYKSSKTPIKPVQQNLAGDLNLEKDKIQESQIQVRSGGKTGSPGVGVGAKKDEEVLEDSESPSEGLVHDFMRIDLKDGDMIVGMMKNRTSGVKRRFSEGSGGSKSPSSPSEIDLKVQQKDKTAPKSLIKRINEDSEVITSKKRHKFEEINDSVPESTPKSSKFDKKKTLYSLRSSSPKKETEEVKKSTEEPKKSVIKQQKAPENSIRDKKMNSKVEKFSKKRQSELAKLEIDGNFVTKPRGPRTRRFPYSMRGFSKRRDNLRHLKGRTKPDLSKKTKLLKRNDVKSSRILQNRPLTTKSSNQNIEPKKSMEESKKLEKSTQKREINKSKMVDKSVQCTLQRDASTSVDPEDLTPEKINRKVQWEEIKSEDEDSEDDLEEIIYADSSVQTQEGLRRSSEGSGGFRRSSEGSGGFGSVNSAFVPVNISATDFRLTMLRSIGFKPIDPCDYEMSAFSEYRQGPAEAPGHAPVVRRDVGEQYEKYTSEETDVVGYMDDELRYQDIEEERGVKKRGGKKKKGAEEEEEPWLGWKKFTHL